MKMYDGIAAALKTVHFIDDCHVFDLGQFRDLSLMISFTDPVFDSTNKGVLTRRVNTLIEQFIGNAGARISANFSPTPLTEWCSTKKKMVHAGYETRSWLVTVDVFHQDRVISDFEPALKRINTLWPVPAR